jgi:hypothetical protein
MENKTLSIIKLEPELFYSLLDEKTKDILDQTTKNTEIVHCYACHHDFVKGVKKKCRGQKESCETHGLLRYNDQVWWCDDSDSRACMDAEAGDDKCVYSDFGETCVSVEVVTHDSDNTECFKTWMKNIVGNKHMKLLKYELIDIVANKFELLVDLHIGRGKTCENKDCVNLKSGIVAELEKQGWNPVVEEDTFDETIEELYGDLNN